MDCHDRRRQVQVFVSKGKEAFEQEVVLRLMYNICCRCYIDRFVFYVYLCLSSFFISLFNYVSVQLFTNVAPFMLSFTFL